MRPYLPDLRASFGLPESPGPNAPAAALACFAGVTLVILVALQLTVLGLCTGLK